MKYRNVTEDQNLSVPTAVQPDGVTVKPGDEILTSPNFAQQFVNAGTLEPVKPKTRSPKKQEAQETTE